MVSEYKQSFPESGLTRKSFMYIFVQGYIKFSRFRFFPVFVTMYNNPGFEQNFNGVSLKARKMRSTYYNANSKKIHLIFNAT